MPSSVITLIIVAGSMFALFIIISTVGNYYSLNRIKNKTVGQGQYGTARWATKKEIKRTYNQIDFKPDEWRTNPDSRPTEQGIVVGCKNSKKVTTAMVDTGDVHALMIGAAGVGKTAYWLYPDGRSFTARVEHLDDYHFDVGGLGNVFHICQFAEVMERNHADFYPEIQTQDEQAAWELGGKGYLAIQSCEDGWDYTIYHSDYSVMDGGQLDAPELTIQEAREQILEAHHMEKGRRLLRDYDAVMDKVAEAEELSADHRPSTLEKLAELANDTSAPKSSAHSAPEL